MDPPIAVGLTKARVRGLRTNAATESLIVAAQGNVLLLAGMGLKGAKARAAVVTVTSVATVAG